MRGFTVIILPAFIAWADAQELAANHSSDAQDAMVDRLIDRLVDRLVNNVNKMLDQVVRTSPVYPSDLDNMTLGKTGHPAIQPRSPVQLTRASLKSLRPLPAHPHSTADKFGVAWKALRPQVQQATVRGVRARAASESTAVDPMPATQGYAKLNQVLSEIGELPPSQRAEASGEATKTVRQVLDAMKAGNDTSRWDSVQKLLKQDIFPGQLRQVGIKNPESIGKPSNQNDFQFLLAVVLSTSLLATVAGATLPGDWGFFVPYLLGGVSILTLAIGSTAPGLLQFAIDRFARLNPEYRERIARHEAAHFLIGYLMGVPVAGYSLGIMVAHTDFLEAKLEQKLFQKRTLTEQELLPLACVAMAGVAAEGQGFEEVMGQEADLRDLQGLLNKVEPKLNDRQQQSLTRWAVWKAASILKTNQQAFDALTDALSQNAPVADCFKAIESAPASR